MDSPFAFFQALVDRLEKVPDQLPGVKSGPVPDDKDAFGIGVHFFQKPTQKFDGVFHVGPVELLEVKLLAEQV